MSDSFRVNRYPQGYGIRTLARTCRARTGARDFAAAGLEVDLQPGAHARGASATRRRVLRGAAEGPRHIPGHRPRCGSSAARSTRIGTDLAVSAGSLDALARRSASTWATRARSCGSCPRWPRSRPPRWRSTATPGRRSGRSARCSPRCARSACRSTTAGGGAAVHHPRVRRGPRRRRSRSTPPARRSSSPGCCWRRARFDRRASRCATRAAGPVAAAHRDDRADDRDAQAPRSKSAPAGAAGLLAGPARAARPRGLHHRARPVQRGPVPGGGAGHRRIGDDQGLAGQTRCSPPTRSWTCSPGWALPSRPARRG